LDWNAAVNVSWLFPAAICKCVSVRQIES
jgi:hypothetical protein